MQACSSRPSPVENEGMGEAPAFSLIGRFADDYFAIGSGREIVYQPSPLGSATLYLRVNDDVPANGNGSFRAQIEVW
jgi:hypothetical protein